jgi:RimJ/RimL family protein N-acetyltransferase
LILRNFRESDLETFIAYRILPDVAMYQGWKLPYPREKALQFFEYVKDRDSVGPGEWLQLAIELKDSGEMIGDVGIFVFRHDKRQARIGFTIVPKHWRKGFALEATLRLLAYLFDKCDFHRVAADCDPLNVGSWKLLEKAGFRREAHHISSYPMGDNHWTDEYVYAMLASEWKDSA